MSNRLAIVGAGDLGKIICFYSSDCGFTSVGFFDDSIKEGSVISGLPVIGRIHDIPQHNSQFDYLIVAVGYKHMNFRKEIYDSLSSTLKFATLVHPTSYVAKSCLIGDGSFILPGCILDDKVSIGNNVLVNLGSTVSHDSKVSNHTFIAPGNSIAGFVTIGEQCFIGIGSTVIDNITICDKTHIGGGTVVVKSISKPGLYVGNPAKQIKKG